MSLEVLHPTLLYKKRLKSQIDVLMKTNANYFSNCDITITYEPNVCTNSSLCTDELSDVFRTSVIPWIDLDGASSERIIKQVKKCPSGALKFHRHKKKVA